MNSHPALAQAWVWCLWNLVPYVMGPQPWPRTSTSPWLVRNQATWQEVSGGWASGEWVIKASSVFTTGLPHITAWALPPVRSAAALDSQRSTNPTLAVSHHPQMGSFSCRKTSLGLPLILHYGELCNYFIIYHNVIIEIKCTKNVICLSHPNTISPAPANLWKNYLPWNWSLVP